MKSIQITNNTISELHDALDIALAADKEYQVSITVFDNSLSNRMTALANIWYQTIDKEQSEIIGEAEAYCKYHFGLKILCRHDRDLDLMVRRMLEPYDYETKKKVIKKNPDFFPVLRNMSIEEKSEYLSCIQKHFVDEGIPLSSPNEIELLNCREANND